MRVTKTNAEYMHLFDAAYLGIIIKNQQAIITPPVVDAIGNLCHTANMAKIGYHDPFTILMTRMAVCKALGLDSADAYHCFSRMMKPKDEREPWELIYQNRKIAIKFTRRPSCSFKFRTIDHQIDVFQFCHVVMDGDRCFVNFIGTEFSWDVFKKLKTRPEWNFYVYYKGAC